MSAQFHDEAFCCAAGLQELAESNLNDGKTESLELVSQHAADLVEDNGATDVNGVAGKANSVSLTDDDSPFRRVEIFDFFDGGLVEGFGKVHHIAAFERREAGVEVVEAGVDKVERHDGKGPGLAEGAMARCRGTGAIACPEAAAISGEESVSFTFKGCGAGNVDESVVRLLEPATKMRLFALALGMEEAADGDDAVAFEAGIGGKDHIG